MQRSNYRILFSRPGPKERVLERYGFGVEISKEFADFAIAQRINIRDYQRAGKAILLGCGFNEAAIKRDFLQSNGIGVYGWYPKDKKPTGLL
jgi:hypothetical protein